VAIDGRGRFVVVATRPGLLMRIRVEDQATEWEETLDEPVADMALTPDERRLVVASGDGRCRVYPLDGGVHRPAEYSIPGMCSLAVSPLFANGRFLVARSDLGLVVLDTQTRTLSQETTATPDAVAISADGRFIVAGAGNTLTMHRLGRPRLKADLSPKSGLTRDQYARLELTLRNAGERPARDIQLTLEGPVEFVAADLPPEVSPHGTAVVSNQSLKPKASGALPVVIRLRYRDDLSFEHEDQERTVLDVAG
jgi:WD40 repeat protein